MAGSGAAFVTGAGTGIGQAIAQRLGALGHAVACTGRNVARCEETAARIQADGGRALAIAMDVTDRASVDAAVERAAHGLGPIAVLVNNAGAGGPNALADEEAWRRIVDTNLTGMYLVTRAVAPRLDDGGRIVNVASVLGRFGVPGYTAYCASKHGVIGFTKALALELASRAITVNAICPGWVDTAMARQGMEAGAQAMGIDVDGFYRQAMSMVPIGRILRPDEVAELVAYLVSPQAAGMTGQGLDLNGGSFMS